MADIVLSLKEINKNFGTLETIKNLNIDIEKGEFLTLLGPSGCGKTTTLRLIAGLETPNSGKIILNGIDITEYSPNKRNINTVFQNYALFPHMNVYKNISYGLSVKKIDKNVIKNRVNEMLELVQMAGFEKRMPNQLSGGQRQRIAIARALINKPDILLFDEPLGALDLKLRLYMQTELKRIHKHTNTTFIYVTHDQGEALNMSDRIAIMENGFIRQIAKPKEIYMRPKTRFVAEFVGDRNILAVKFYEARENFSIVSWNNQELYCSKENFEKGDTGILAILSDKIAMHKEKPKDFYIEGIIKEHQYTGASDFFQVLTSKGDVLKVINYEHNKIFKENDVVFLNWEICDSVFIKEEGTDL